MSANILQPEKIEIVDFKIIKGQINSPFDFEKEKVAGHTFNVDFELGFNLEDKLVKADFSVHVETKSNEDSIEEAVGNFSFVYVFYVDNIEELTTLEKDETITIHPALGNALASITYSTSRGILMTRFQGTVLSDFILPVINPNDLLEKGSK
ncbi:hypothetical protein FLSI110296_15640 [Flavobacterium sinopsychrotolerans]|jgi:hypothetical protein|uniref:Preprotein translocase subunit SecB n=1 Tax=Flavobacterium sinopsychrotolerans TaxID=604089 RepID=A0A1H8HIG0_9FLAO|nr:hypothetical protein [Flavobacterium sinopsychrotolerans]SEN55747.1 hypothetical protein SAMN04487942_0205 [Flavobacterium sinopsychrotolerans]